MEDCVHAVRTDRSVSDRRDAVEGVQATLEGTGSQKVGDNLLLHAAAKDSQPLLGLVGR